MNTDKQPESMESNNKNQTIITELFETGNFFHGGFYYFYNKGGKKIIEIAWNVLMRFR